MSACEIEAFDRVALMTKTIELCARRLADSNGGASTAIDTLHSIIINQKDNPESGRNANEAYEALHALQTAVKLLITNIGGV